MSQVITITLNTTAQGQGMNVVVNGLNKVKNTTEKVDRSFNKFGTTLKRMIAPLTALLSAGALVRVTQQTLGHVDAMAKSAQGAGMNVEAFSRLTFAANKAGLSKEHLRTATSALNRHLARTGQVGRDLTEVLLEQADVFAAMPDSLDKVAQAQRVFGEEAGARLLPLLNQGSDAMREQLELADKLGITIGSTLAVNAQKFNDRLSDLKNVLRGVVQTVLNQFLPGWTQYIEKLLEAGIETDSFIKSAEKILDIAKVIIFLGKAVGRTASLFLQFFRTVGNAIGNWVNAQVSGYQLVADAILGLGIALSDVAEGNFESAVSNFKKTWAVVQSDFDVFKESIKLGVDQLGGDLDTLWKKATAPLEFPKLGVGIGKEPPMLGPPVPNNLAKQGIALTKEQIKHQEELDRIRTESIMKAIDLQKAMTENILVGFDQTFEMAKNDFEARLRQIGELQIAEEEALKLTELAHIEHAERIKQIEQAQADARLDIQMQTARGISGILGNLTEVARAFGRKGFAAYKAFASAQAAVETAVSAISAYKAMVGIPYVGPILAPIAAAAAIAAGTAQIVAINSTQPTGFESGGLVRGPRQIIQVNEAGTESVLNASATARLGEGAINALNAGVMGVAGLESRIASSFGPPVESASSGGMGGGGGGDGRVALLLVDSRNSQAAKDFIASEAGRVQIIEIVRDNKVEAGVKS